MIRVLTYTGSAYLFNKIVAQLYKIIAKHLFVRAEP